MTTDAHLPERDPALDAAWREHSAELPPSALDAAILAAAHRAVGSAPQVASPRAAEATSPQRWWMPLAAAATIGAVALGLVQTMPHQDAVTSPVVSDMPARAQERDAVAPPGTPPLAREAAKPDVREPATVVAQAPAAAPPSAPMKATAPALSPAPAPMAAAPPPQPFPAEKKAEAAEPADLKENRAQERADAQPMPAVPPAVAPKLSVPATVGSTLAAAPPGAAPAPAPAMDASAPMRQRNESAAATGALALGKSAARMDAAPSAASPPAPQSAGAAAAVDVDAAIARIRKLHDEGKLADAARELVALRAAIPDADARLPRYLRAWAATVKP